MTEAQYRHVVDQLRALAREADPTHAITVTVRSVEDYHELKDKDGPLRKINLRVFFFVEKEARYIVVLGAMKKEADGPTPPATKRLMKVRKRKYLSGQYETSG